MNVGDKVTGEAWFSLREGAVLSLSGINDLGRFADCDFTVEHVISYRVVLFARREDLKLCARIYIEQEEGGSCVYGADNVTGTLKTQAQRKPNTNGGHGCWEDPEYSAEMGT